MLTEANKRVIQLIFRILSVVHLSISFDGNSQRFVNLALNSKRLRTRGVALEVFFACWVLIFGVSIGLSVHFGDLPNTVLVTALFSWTEFVFMWLCSFSHPVKQQWLVNTMNQIFNLDEQFKGLLWTKAMLADSQTEGKELSFFLISFLTGICLCSISIPFLFYFFPYEPFRIIIYDNILHFFSLESSWLYRIICPLLYLSGYIVFLFNALTFTVYIVYIHETNSWLTLFGKHFQRIRNDRKFQILIRTLYINNIYLKNNNRYLFAIYYYISSFIQGVVLYSCIRFYLDIPFPLNFTFPVIMFNSFLLAKFVFPPCSNLFKLSKELNSQDNLKFVDYHVKVDRMDLVKKRKEKSAERFWKSVKPLTIEIGDFFKLNENTMAQFYYIVFDNALALLLTL